MGDPEGGTASITIDDFWPDRASYRPGEPVTLQLGLVSTHRAAMSFTLDLRVLWLDTPIHCLRQPLLVIPGAMEARLRLSLPREPFRGYGIDLALLDPSGRSVARASTALDVLQRWAEAPRYGFLADFQPDDPAATAHVDTLARYHVNVVQFYDWMWRHYALLPPEPVFSDALGRRLSLHTVREKVAACTARSMASMGYAAVYGAEPEYAFAHRDEILHDAEGHPYSLAQLFYIMNIHQGSPWRARILAEMAGAVREVPFDGLHLDQYGFPRETAYGPAPERVPYQLADDFPSLIDDARRAVRTVHADAGVIFNAVENWPIEQVAPTTQDVTYIEVWPPYTGYGDLQALIGQARRLAPTKQVILAAYITPLHDATEEMLPRAEAAAQLASAAIWANGGFHLLLGEANGALCDPYYPKYATLRPSFARVMRAYYDFVVRYENMLSDPRAVDGEPASDAVRSSAVPVSTQAVAGAVWAIERTLPGFQTISLINLTAAMDDAWNAPKLPPPVLGDLALDFPVMGAVRGVFAASPDRAHGQPESLPFLQYGSDGARRLAVRLPSLRCWSLLVVKLEQEEQ